MIFPSLPLFFSLGFPVFPSMRGDSFCNFPLFRNPFQTLPVAFLKTKAGETAGPVSLGALVFHPGPVSPVPFSRQDAGAGGVWGLSLAPVWIWHFVSLERGAMGLAPTARTARLPPAPASFSQFSFSRQREPADLSENHPDFPEIPTDGTLFETAVYLTENPIPPYNGQCITSVR